MKTLTRNQKERIKQDVMDFVVAHPRSLSPTRSFWHGWLMRPAVSGLLVLFLFVSTGSIWASNSAPGDFLYPIKRWSENRRLAWLQDPSEREAWLRELANRRIEELDAAINTHGNDESLAETQRDLAEVVAKSSDEELRQMISNKLAVLERKEETVVAPEILDFVEEATSETELNIHVSTDEANLTSIPEASTEASTSSGLREATSSSKPR